MGQALCQGLSKQVSITTVLISKPKGGQITQGHRASKKQCWNLNLQS